MDRRRQNRHVGRSCPNRPRSPIETSEEHKPVPQRRKQDKSRATSRLNSSSDSDDSSSETSSTGNKTSCSSGPDDSASETNNDVSSSSNSDSDSDDSSSGSSSDQAACQRKAKRLPVRRCMEHKRLAKEAMKVEKQIVHLLLDTEGRQKRLKSISAKLRVPTKTVLESCNARKELFVTSADGTVSLNLRKIAVCQGHWTREDHLWTEACGFHICPDWIVDGYCEKGKDCHCCHSLKRQINKTSIAGSGLEGLSTATVKAILKPIVTGLLKLSHLRFCEEYYVNSGNCSRGHRCDALHLCPSVALPTMFESCNLETCFKNHDLRATSCCSIYRICGLSDNVIHGSSPRDLCAIIGPRLMEDPLLARIQSFKFKTAADEDGDVNVLEICINSLDEKGCPRLLCEKLHAIHLDIPYQWQLLNPNATEGQPKWLNLPPTMNEEIDDQFCLLEDCEDADVTVFELAHLHEIFPEEDRQRCQSLAGLLDEDEHWEVDFSDETSFMKMHTLPANDGQKRELLLRRLSTPSAGISKHPFATKYVWYFAGDTNQWVPFGSNSKDAGSFPLLFMRPLMDPASIEEAFCAKMPSLMFRQGWFTYEINFGAMTQRNTQSGKIRKVIRRPWKAPKPSIIPCFPVPKTWTPMKKTDIIKLEEVDMQSAEFQEMKTLLESKGGIPFSSGAISKLVRVQNHYNWQEYQKKKKDMIHEKGVQESSNKDPMLKLMSSPPINERRVFHGTGLQCIDSIVKNGFAWQLATVHYFGKGVYFATETPLAAAYSKGGAHLIVARVLVGNAMKTESGKDANLETPGPGYDSTYGYLGGNRNKKLRVIYDQSMMYPEYVVYF